jgi:hypothetical protein
MKKVSGILAILFAATVLLAQAPPKPSDAPKIPLQLLKDFYAADSARLRAQAELTKAQRDAEGAGKDWQQAVEAMQKACGDKFILHQDSVDADPNCVPKPPEAPATEKK